jgi:hypothetical protein
MPNLTPSEEIWLKALDIAELYLWCLDECAMGNTGNTKIIMENCEDWVDRTYPALPEEFLFWWKELGFSVSSGEYVRTGDSPWKK